MRKHSRAVLGAVLMLVAVVALAACGSSSNSSNSSSTSSSTASTSSSTASTPTSSSTGPITLVMGTAPDSLDPGFGYTTQAAEPDWLAYTGLVQYAHASGTAGGQLIPGLATALPSISADGKTYTATLRSGLTYSNGAPVKASDFLWAVEREIKIPWGGSSFVTSNVVGAAAYAANKAKTISGITVNDSTGKITIKLVAPYGAFDNILAFPSLALVPTGTPFKNMPNNPPPGCGPYIIKNVVPNEGFQLVRNPKWASFNIPGIPSGHVDVNVKISSNVSANALAVLQNSVDVFDWADTVPGPLLPQVNSTASDRFKKEVMNSTYYIFMNSQEKPFNNQLAREAVVTGLDERAFNRLGAGTLLPGCYFLPPGMVGHPTGPCPYGDPAAGGNLAKAQALVKQSGMAGYPV